MFDPFSAAVIVGLITLYKEATRADDMEYIISIPIEQTPNTDHSFKGEETLDSVRNLIAENQLKKALNLIKEIYDRSNKNIPNEITIFQRRLEDLKSQYNLGIINNDNYQVEKNKISLGILEFISNL